MYSKLKYHTKKDKFIPKLYISIKILTILLVTAAIIFVKYIISNEFISAKTYLEQNVQQTASNLNGRVNNSINEMRVLSAKLSHFSTTYSEKDIKDFLLTHVMDYDFYKIIYVYPNGQTVIVEKGSGLMPIVNIKNSPDFDKIMYGNSTFINTVENPNVPSGYVNTFGIPVYDNNKRLKGLLLSQVFGKTYTEILAYNNYNDKGYSYVIDDKGNYIIKSKNDTTHHLNFFENNIKFMNTSREKILSQLKNNDYGVFNIKINNERYIASFALIDQTKHYVLTLVPLHVLMLNIDRLLIGITIIVLTIGILLFSLLYFSHKMFRRNEKTIYNIAFTDEITGNGNKNKFLLEASEILNENNNDKYAMINAEIIDFKAIKELYGQKRANEILKEVYKIINQNLHNDGICVRTHDADFLILYKYQDKDLITNIFLERISQDIEIYSRNGMNKMIQDYESPKTAQIKLLYGIYLIDDKKIDISTMSEKASIAKISLYGQFLSQYKFYDDAMTQEMLREKKIEEEMYTALNNKQFEMFLQPKFNLSSNEICGAEALIRWRHPEKGLIPPGSFIPLFEKNGFILEIDRFIWEEACKFIADMIKKGIQPYPISVNVSRIHMNNDSFVSELVLLTKKYQIDPYYLELEVTETASFDNTKRFIQILKDLRANKFKILMDDFGTGYSSLNMLRHLPVDILKLDMGFIKDSVNNKQTQLIIESIINMAQKLNIETVAEGVETEQQSEFLRKINCNYAQGYLYGKPMEANLFIEKLDKDTRIKKGDNE